MGDIMGEITFHDKKFIKNFFNNGGYVLDFSNREFDDFTYNSIGVRIQEKYGLSKGKSLELYIEEALDEDILKLVKDLLIYYDDLPENSIEKSDIRNNQAEKLKEKINLYLSKEKLETEEVFLAEGGFANIFFHKPSQKIIKKLKNEFINSTDHKSRFKREFNIMKSLAQVDGVIRVYEFNDLEFSYTMEKADFTLNDYIINNEIELNQKLNLIYQILSIMANVHSLGIYHRDLSPNNIFLCNGLIKISDFGLAKDSNLNHSHLTANTNNYGQYYYCAPEQIQGLKNATKISDVFSLGKVINFCLTGKPNDDKHILRSFVQKATSELQELRYNDAEEMITQFKYYLDLYYKKDSKEKILNRIQKNEFNDTIIEYLNNIPNDDLCKELIEIGEKYKMACINFMKIRQENALYLIRKIFPSFKTVAISFEENDIFASFAYDVLRDDSFDFLTKETAAQILYYVASEVNRFSAQRLIDKLKRNSIEPMLECILDGSEFLV